jgi:hypothetical protein
MTATSRDSLLEAIDALARAAHSGDRNLVEKRRHEARALAALLVPAPLAAYPCDHCGIRVATQERLDEHCYHVHDGPKPSHWIDDTGAPS